MNIDEPTLMIVLGIASVTASAMFFTLHRSARHIGGVHHWAFGSLLVGFAVLLDGPRVIENWQWASLLFNIPLSVGQVLFLVGTAQFVGRPLRPHALAVLVAIVIFLTTLFTVVLPNSVDRIVSLSFFQATINVWTAWLLWTHRESNLSRVYGSASLVTVVQASAAFTQAFLVGTSSVAITYAAPQLPFANLITWVATMSNVLLGNWILFLLIMLRLVAELKIGANSDSLTGLLNRRGLRFHIDAITAPSREIRALAVLLIDIDHFKRVNDEHGHDTGDKVLALMGKVMRDLSSSHVVPCRWGGEEFCFIVDSFTDNSLIELAEKTSKEFSCLTRTLLNLPSEATVSIGVAAMDVDNRFEFSTLVGLADSQLYCAKKSGRNRVCSTVGQTKNKMPPYEYAH
jgi:diguanylate cyclase (GGDEF)-like protein